ncbi:cytochrome P450 [Aspergillus heteromorphus CBS 117.55]|uniref:Cytochrome P450 n=1 Tax=Aspergillus heteromorphus CBS 117.55 TaxID=1448321 RepID=A0A317WX03_9EURO|nr:cytochrome P450 [Aspergillus heteromorphus CBS 117.55]PWY89862.1 cytochrome P450 [Aspergillus heteromorphus CBS 117.55]
MVLTEHSWLMWQILLALPLLVGFILLSNQLLCPSPSKKTNSTIPAVGVSPGPLGSWTAGIRFVKHSASIIQYGYEKYAPDQKAFKISTLPRWVVVATHDAAIKQLQDSDEQFLSMQEAANERNSISYVLGKYIHENPYHMSIVQRRLTPRLSQILPEVIEDLDLIFGDFQTTATEWAALDHHKIAERCISAITNRALLGPTLAGDLEFLDSVLELSNVISRAGLVIDLTPRSLKSLMARFLVHRHAAFKIYLSKVIPLFKDRRRAYRENGDQVERPNDAIQWFLEAAPATQSEYDLALYILYIQFSAIHTSSASLVNVLHDLAASPGFQNPIKDEVNAVLQKDGNWTKQSLAKMGKLDSSVRESQRLHPVTTATMMRKVLQPYTLVDGTHLSPGQWVVAPAWAINRSLQKYDHPTEFNAFSPGRFFAMMELKLVTAYIVQKFEFRLGTESEGVRPQNGFFCFSCVPDSESRLLFKMR